MTDIDIDKTEDTIRRAQRAAAILGDPLFKEAFDRTERRYVSEWRSAKSIEGREFAHAKLTALEDVALCLRAVLESGEYAAAALKRAGKRKPEASTSATS